MIKNIVIVILLFIVATVCIYALQKAKDTDKVVGKLRDLTVELTEERERADRLKLIAEQQAVKATNAEADALIMAQALEKCKKRN